MACGKTIGPIHDHPYLGTISRELSDIAVSSYLHVQPQSSYGDLNSI